MSPPVGQPRATNGTHRGRHRGLGGRLALISAGAVALAIALASAVGYVAVRDQLLDQVDSTLRDRAGRASLVLDGRPLELPLPRGLGARPPGSPPGDSLRLPGPPPGGFEALGRLVTAEGAVLASAGLPDEVPVSEAAREVAAGERPERFEQAEVEGISLRILSRPASPGVAIQVARSLEEVQGALSDLLGTLALVAVAGVAFAGFAGLAVSRTSLAPIRRLSDAAERVARTGDLSERIGESGDDEVARLTRSFNGMMAALEQSTEAQRRLVADASHELRTPITTLRMGIGTLARADSLTPEERRRLIEDLELELEELGSLVGDIVELARDPGSASQGVTDVRLDELAREAVDRARRRSPGLSFSERYEPSLVRGDPERLDRAIRNLLDNATKWSPRGGTVEVEAAGGRVSVRDHGEGIAAEDLPRVFDRFFRADRSRGKPGSGLGLAIVRRVADEHGGRAWAANATGGGAIVSIELPAAGPDGAERERSGDS